MKWIPTLFSLLLMLGLSAPAEAALIDRGTGMIYDTDLGETHLIRGRELGENEF